MSRPLFDAVDEVGSRVVRAPYLLIFLDFDGTLAPFVSEPVLAGLSPHMDRVLRSLAARPTVTVAIVSGRERADLQNRVGIPGLIYAGNHGLEINGRGFIFVEPMAAARAGAVKEIANQLAEELEEINGVFVEDKGLSVGIHYRQAAPEDFEHIRQKVDTVLDRANDPFQLLNGERIHEIRPPVHWNKGNAVGWIRQQVARPASLSIYLGDDATDEDAFAVLAKEITIKVGDPSNTAARYHLEGPVEVRKFLEWLDNLLEKHGAHG
jgi:trehalose 6-phosphate phosphatase